MPHRTSLIATLVAGIGLAFILIEHARAANPNIEIIARAHTDAEVEHLKRLEPTSSL
jgi:voltage-gated potassium channel Kch